MSLYTLTVKNLDLSKLPSTWGNAEDSLDKILHRLLVSVQQSQTEIILSDFAPSLKEAILEDLDCEGNIIREILTNYVLTQEP